MMELLRTWLIGITAASMVVAVAESLSPEGAAKKIGRLAGGLLLAIAILKPVVAIDDAAMAGILTEYRFGNQGYSAALETENERLIKTIIVEQTGAYIQDKAAELGMLCTVEVTCGKNDDGSFYPASVILCGRWSEGQAADLSRILERDLAIPAQNQQYERTGDG